MKKNKAIWIDRTLISSPLYICLCTNETQYLKEIKRLKIPKEAAPDFVNEGKDGTVHVFEKKEDLCIFVCIKKRKGGKTSEVYGLICHEAVHVWQEIKHSIGEDNPSMEFEAYSIQNIFQQLIEAYNSK